MVSQCYNTLKVKCVLFFYIFPNLGAVISNLIFFIFMFCWCHGFKLPVAYAMENDITTTLEQLTNKAIEQCNSKIVAKKILQTANSLDLSGCQNILSWKYHIGSNDTLKSIVALFATIQEKDPQAMYINGSAVIQSIEKCSTSQHYIGDTSFFLKVQKWYFEQLYLKNETDIVTSLQEETRHFHFALTDNKIYHPHVVTQYNLKEKFVVYRMNLITTSPLEQSFKIRNTFAHLFASQEILKLINIGALDFPYGTNLLKKEMIKYVTPVSKLFVITENTINEILELAHKQLNIINIEYLQMQKKLNSTSDEKQKAQLIKLLTPHIKLIQMLNIIWEESLDQFTKNQLTDILDELQNAYENKTYFEQTLIQHLLQIPKIALNNSNKTIDNIVTEIENTIIEPPLNEFMNNKNFVNPSKNLLLNSQKIAQIQATYAPAIEKCKSLLKLKQK